MTASEDRPARRRPASCRFGTRAGRAAATSAPTDRPGDHHSAGAGVDVDPRRARQLVVAVCLVALAVVAVILLVAGLQKNAQADSLQQHGVPVTVTVTGCLGLLGGSGSNGAGYACKGTYTFDGRHYVRVHPGRRPAPARGRSSGA